VVLGDAELEELAQNVAARAVLDARREPCRSASDAAKRLRALAAFR